MVRLRIVALLPGSAGVSRFARLPRCPARTPRPQRPSSSLNAAANPRTSSTPSPPHATVASARHTRQPTSDQEPTARRRAASAGINRNQLAARPGLDPPPRSRGDQPTAAGSQLASQCPPPRTDGDQPVKTGRPLMNRLSAPRARGSTGLGRAIVNDPHLRPARAGINLRGVAVRKRYGAPPRARGDQPDGPTACATRSTSAPRTRGSTSRHNPARAYPHLHPAGTGIYQAAASRPRQPFSAPQARGPTHAIPPTTSQTDQPGIHRSVAADATARPSRSDGNRSHHTPFPKRSPPGLTAGLVPVLAHPAPSPRPRPGRADARPDLAARPAERYAGAMRQLCQPFLQRRSTHQSRLPEIPRHPSVTDRAPCGRS